MFPLETGKEARCPLATQEVLHPTRRHFAFPQQVKKSPVFIASSRMQGGSREVSQVVVGSFGFLLSFDVVFWEPGMLSQASQASFQVLRAIS